MLRQFWRERQKSIIHNDLRDAVVAESEFEVQAAAALEGTLAHASSRVRSGIWEAPKVQPGKSTIQFFVKGKVGMSTCVVRGHVEAVSWEMCMLQLGGSWWASNSTLSTCGVTPDCTVRLHARIRSGSLENVPGQWTRSNCFADRCWPVRTRCCRCREPRGDAFPPLWKGKRREAADNRVQGLIYPAPEAPPSEDVVKATKLLQSVMTPEDFSKNEKKLVVLPRKEEHRVKLREQEVFETVQIKRNIWRNRSRNRSKIITTIWISKK